MTLHLAPHLMNPFCHARDELPARRAVHNAAALRRRAIDIAAGLDLHRAPAVAMAVLAEVAQRDAGAGLSDGSFEAWLDAVTRIRPAAAGRGNRRGDA